MSERDPLWYSPVFVLAPARSNATIVTAMLGMHPALSGFPELALFRRATVAELLVDPTGWRGPAADLRLAGLLRAIAQQHDGKQTEEAVVRALEWLQARRSWPVELVMDHLLGGVAPLTGIEKSPENASQEQYLTRLTRAYPRARFLHVTRHPLTSEASMYKHWRKLDYWDIQPELFHHFCLGIWCFQHGRIDRLIRSLPSDRGLRVRSEDVVNNPGESLPRVCRWLGVDAGAEAIEQMRHPERSPYARIGPPGALGGGDSGFLSDPVARPVDVPDSLELPADWVVDPWQWLAVVELATRLGYAHHDRQPDELGYSSSDTDLASSANSS